MENSTEMFFKNILDNSIKAVVRVFNVVYMYLTDTEWPSFPTLIPVITVFKTKLYITTGTALVSIVFKGCSTENLDIFIKTITDSSYSLCANKTSTGVQLKEQLRRRLGFIDSRGHCVDALLWFVDPARTN